MNILKLIGRDKELFTDDIAKHEEELKEIVSASRFLVIGGAGSIGQAVTKEIFKRIPKKLHVEIAFGVGGKGACRESRHRRACRIGAVGGVGDEHCPSFCVA